MQIYIIFSGGSSLPGHTVHILFIFYQAVPGSETLGLRQDRVWWDQGNMADSPCSVRLYLFGNHETYLQTILDANSNHF